MLDSEAKSIIDEMLDFQDNMFRSYNDSGNDERVRHGVSATIDYLTDLLGRLISKEEYKK